MLSLSKHEEAGTGLATMADHVEGWGHKGTKLSQIQPCSSFLTTVSSMSMPISVSLRHGI